MSNMNAIILFLATGVVLAILSSINLIRSAYHREDFSLSTIWMIILLWLGGWITILTLFFDIIFFSNSRNND